MMDDPADKKPDDWATEKRIVDTAAKKPDDRPDVGYHVSFTLVTFLRV